MDSPEYRSPASGSKGSSGGDSRPAEGPSATDVPGGLDSQKTCREATSTRHILDVSPEEDDLFEPFRSLYRKARQDFCYRLSKAVDVHFSKMLLQREDPALRQAVDCMISDTAHTVVPSGEMTREYIEADGRLIEPHPDQEWRLGRTPEGPLECAYINLFLWVYAGLHGFWRTRLDGEMAVVVNVSRYRISVKGVLPDDVARVLYRPDEEGGIPSAIGAKYKQRYNDLSRQRSASQAEETSDPPF